MTFYTDIQNAQTVIHQPFANKPVLVRVPLSVADILNHTRNSLWLFDPTLYDTNDTIDYVYLRLFPQYSVDDEFLGDRALKTSFNGTVATYSTQRKGFKATIIQPQSWIYRVIEEVAQISMTSTYNRYAPVKIIDCCRPDKSAVNVGGHAGTIRYGWMVITKTSPIVQGSDGLDYCREPWELSFKEIAAK